MKNIETSYKFANHNSVIVETYNIENNEFVTVFNKITLDELKDMAKSDCGVFNRINDRDINQIVTILERKNVFEFDLIKNLYIDKSQSNMFDTLLIELSNNNLDIDKIKLLANLETARMDELTFVKPNVIRAWWD